MSAQASVAWRFAVLAGLVTGLGVAGSIRVEAAEAPLAVALLGAGAVAVRPRSPHTPPAPWIAAVGILAAAAGLAIGGARIESIDARALDLPADEVVTVDGLVVSPPRAGIDGVRFVLESGGGRIGVEASVLDPEVDEGRAVTATGTVRALAPWEETLRRQGIARVLAGASVRATGGSRAGLSGALDAVRRRAEAALDRGTSPPAAALLRGFVLGQDDRILEPVREDFRRSGLAHILAVSGQNVMLLALLATPILALAGVPLRARLVATAAIIAVYVPVAGAGPSIQRAGVMGIAGLVAALSSRPRHRWYALGLAAAVTLAVDPRASADVGWQLSFAAVAGLLLLTQPLVRVLAPPGGFSSAWRRALCEGGAMTVAATLSTAPLVAHHFGVVSLTAVPANLLALPAVAPAMWMGMLAGALGQVPGVPVELCSWLGGLFAAYIGWVAHALGGAWAQLELPEPGLGVALAWTVALIGVARLACLGAERRSGMRAAPRRRGQLAIAAVAALAGGLAASWLGPAASVEAPREAPARLVVRFLDVGQGDSILLEPGALDPVLVDTGPPEGRAVERLRELGVDRLSALVITHDQRDHAGALPAILAAIRVDQVVAGATAPSACHRIACPGATLVAAGDTIRAGPLRLRALWPSSDDSGEDDPNLSSLVLRAELGDFDALLTGDAEAEVAGFHPGAVDVLKVAHHGSADPGLGALLREARPDLAVVSAGANPYGHPAPATLAELDAAGVPIARTDVHGEVVVEVHRDGWRVG